MISYIYMCSKAYASQLNLSHGIKNKNTKIQAEKLKTNTDML